MQLATPEISLIGVSGVELKYTDMDGAVDKTKLNIFEDGPDEEFLKLVKEVQNYIETFDIWQDENAAHTIYKTFHCFLTGVIGDDQASDKLTFEEHLNNLISTVLGKGALCKQKEYLKKTPKLEKIIVKQWINRIKHINSYLPLVQKNALPFLEKIPLLQSLLPIFLQPGARIKG